MVTQESCEQYFRDRETGLIFSFLDRNTLLPATEELFGDAELDVSDIVSGFSASECYMHENFGMCTGAYMISEVLRHKRTGSDQALKNAAICLEGLRYAYKLGDQMEHGFFPKVYGRRFSRETSTDQVLYACYAMDAYYPFASPAECTWIEEMIPSLVDFWLRRDYRYHYFTICDDTWQWPLKRFPALLTLAEKYDGGDKFRKEFERMEEFSKTPENCQLACAMERNAPTEYEIANGGWLTAAGADRVTMDTMNFSLLLKNKADHPFRELWKDGIRKIWNEVKTTLTLDGRYLSMTITDFKTGECRRTPGYAMDGTNYHGAKSSWSTMVVRAGLMAMEFLPDLADEVIPLAENVFSKLNLSDCTYYDEPERFAPGERFKTRLLSGDAVTNYLWGTELLRRALQENDAYQSRVSRTVLSMTGGKNSSVAADLSPASNLKSFSVAN